MQTEKSQKIIARFFQALEYLKAYRLIRGKYSFARAHNVDFRNFYKIEKDHSRDLFQVEWIADLVSTYKVNPHWLLLGEGSFFMLPYSEKSVKQILKQNPCNVKTIDNKQTDN